MELPGVPLDQARERIAKVNLTWSNAGAEVDTLQISFVANQISISK